MQVTFADRALRSSRMKLDGPIIGAKRLLIIAQVRPAISDGRSRFARPRLKFLGDLIPAQRAIRTSENVKDHPEKDRYAIGDSAEFERPHFLLQRFIELAFLVVDRGESTMGVCRIGRQFQRSPG